MQRIVQPRRQLRSGWILAALTFCALTATVTAQEAPLVCVPQIGPLMSVTALDFSPDGKLLAQGGGGGWGSAASEINLWDAQSGELLRPFPAPSGPVTLVRFVANGTQLATATTSSHGTPADGIVRFWDVKNGQLLRTLPPQGAVFAVAVSSDGQWVARSQPSPETLHAASERLLTLENTVTGAKRTLAATGVVYRLAFSPDAHTLFGADAGGMRAWEVDTGTVRMLAPAQLPQGIAKPRGMELVERTPSLPQFSVDGKWYADEVPGGIGVWQTETGKRQAWMELAQSPNNKVTAVVFFDSDNQVALRIGESLRFWNLTTGQNEIPNVAPLPNTLGSATVIAVTPDSKTVAFVVDRWGSREMRTREIIKEIHLLKLPGAAPLRVITGRVNPATWVGFSPDGTTLYSTWHDTGVRFWDTRTGQLKNSWTTTLGTNEALAISRDGMLIARGNGFRNGNENATVLYTGGSVLTKLTASNGLIHHLAISPDNTRMAVDYGTNVRLYELPSGRELNRFNGLGGMIFASSFSPDGKTLATIGTGGACLWSVADGELIGRLLAINFNPYQAVFSPDGHFIASLEHERVMLWDAATQTALCGWTQGRDRPSSAVFSSDGAMLAIAINSAVRIYDLKNLPDVKTALRDGPRNATTAPKTWDLPGGIMSIAFSPDRATLAAACGDGAIRLVNVNVGRLRAELRVLPPPGDEQISREWAAIIPDGSFIGSPNSPAFLRWREGDNLVADAARLENSGRVQQALAP